MYVTLNIGKIFRLSPSVGRLNILPAVGHRSMKGHTRIRCISVNVLPDLAQRYSDESE